MEEHEALCGTKHFICRRAAGDKPLGSIGEEPRVVFILVLDSQEEPLGIGYPSKTTNSVD